MSKTISISASNVIDLLGLVHDRIYNSAQAVMHRPENGDGNEHFEFIVKVTRRLEDFFHPLANGSLTRIASKRGVLVEIPDDLLSDIQKLPHKLRAITTEELGKRDLGHLEGEERGRVLALHEDFNPGVFDKRHNRRISTVTESTLWQEQIDTIIGLARTRPEPIKRLESLADLTAEIIDCAAARLDLGSDPQDKFGLTATTIKQSIFDECRRKPYNVTPKFIRSCRSHIENMAGLAQSGLEMMKIEHGEKASTDSNLHVAIERCEQFKQVLCELERSLQHGGRTS